jgi:hypothetical protein
MEKEMKWWCKKLRQPQARSTEEHGKLHMILVLMVWQFKKWLLFLGIILRLEMYLDGNPNLLPLFESDRESCFKFTCHQ